MHHRFVRGLVCVVGICMLTVSASADDWLRFRGPNGSGNAAGDVAPPTAWDQQTNTKWRVELPGPGTSSPIVVGDKVFVTCWSGYGVDRDDPGEQFELLRHLICLDRSNGHTIWSREVEAILPEDRYGGMFAEHGYASHTPVSDGQRVYAFFGKSGVVAFDMSGEKLWQTSVGTGLDPSGWGSAASPILYGDMLYVPATAESASLVALDKLTGEVRWKKEADGFQGTWATPVIVQVDQNRADLVMAVPGEVWGFDPATGKLRWYCESINDNSQNCSAVTDEGIVYVVGARDGSTVAIRAGGMGDVTDTHVVWRGNERARIGTPLVREGRLYWINSGVAVCVDAATGKRVYQARLGRPAGQANEQVSEPAAPSDRGRGGRGGGGMGGQDYSSPVAAANLWYYVTRVGQAHVMKLGDAFDEIAVNVFADGGEFSATPAVSNGDLFIRSTKHVYCIGVQADSNEARSR